MKIQVLSSSTSQCLSHVTCSEMYRVTSETVLTQWNEAKAQTSEPDITRIHWSRHQYLKSMSILSCNVDSLQHIVVFKNREMSPVTVRNTRAWVIFLPKPKLSLKAHSDYSKGSELWGVKKGVKSKKKKRKEESQHKPINKRHTMQDLCGFNIRNEIQYS